jgi:hypothetical protein
MPNRQWKCYRSSRTYHLASPSGSHLDKTRCGRHFLRADATGEHSEDNKPKGGYTCLTCSDAWWREQRKKEEVAGE